MRFYNHAKNNNRQVPVATIRVKRAILIFFPSLEQKSNKEQSSRSTIQLRRPSNMSTKKSKIKVYQQFVDNKNNLKHETAKN
uniref:Ovule protein n=1 Tax=Panagrolaimus sp. JU765 TaxID=591449 RepID=A0AC34QYY9_9BILA